MSEDKVKKSARWRRWYADNKKRVAESAKKRRAEHPQKTKDRWNAWYVGNYVKNVLRTIEVRAAEKGLAFNLEPADVVVPAICPVLGIPIAPSRGKAGPNSPSIDRVDNRLGYIKGNIRVISLRANKLKSDMSLGEAAALYEYMLDHAVSMQSQRLEAR